MPACCALAAICVFLYLVAASLAAPLANAVGAALVRLASGRVTDAEGFIAGRIREAALLTGFGAMLSAGTVALSLALFSRLKPVARWTMTVATAVAAVNIWVWAASGTVLFWATLYFGGPNLMQSAYHFERLLAKESTAPVKAVVLGSSQGGSQIHGGVLNELFEPGVRMAMLAYAGTEASEFVLESELYADIRPQAAIVYINESNFYQGVSGSRYLPFMTWAGLEHVLQSGALELGARPGLSYALVGLVSPLFHVRRAVEFFVFGYAAANREFARPASSGAAAGLEERAAQLASTYHVDQQSDFQKSEFLRFLQQQFERGTVPLVLVGQVNPILERQIPTAVRSDFRAYVSELQSRYPENVVPNAELPQHAPEDYFPADLMHVNHETRRAFTERTAELLEERFGWVVPDSELMP